MSLIKANLASSPLHMMKWFKLTKKNNEDLELIEMSYGYQIWGSMQPNHFL